MMSKVLKTYNFAKSLEAEVLHKNNAKSEKTIRKMHKLKSQLENIQVYDEMDITTYANARGIYQKLLDRLKRLS